MRRAGLTGLVLIALLASSCVRGRWSRNRRLEPLSTQVVASLEVGRSSLGDCMELMGAPVFVWERTSDTFAIAYGWLNDRGLGGTVSVPTGQVVSASLSIDDLSANLRGVVLIFDRDDTLQLIKEGYLAEVAPELLKRRPIYDDSWYEDDDSSSDSSDSSG